MVSETNSTTFLKASNLPSAEQTKQLHQNTLEKETTDEEMHSIRALLSYFQFVNNTKI